MLTRTVSKALLASIAAGLATLAMVPAHAELGAPRSVVVSFADLNLNSDAGQARLNKRIAFAAETVCGPVDMMNYQSRRALAACETDAITRAKGGMVQVFAQAGNSIRIAAR